MSWITGPDLGAAPQPLISTAPVTAAAQAPVRQHVAVRAGLAIAARASPRCADRARRCVASVRRLVWNMMSDLTCTVFRAIVACLVSFEPRRSARSHARVWPGRLTVMVEKPSAVTHYQDERHTCTLTGAGACYPDQPADG
jgi:hypothetical protein